MLANISDGVDVKGMELISDMWCECGLSGQWFIRRAARADGLDHGTRVTCSVHFIRDLLRELDVQEGLTGVRGEVSVRELPVSVPEV